MTLQHLLISDAEAQDILAWAFITKEQCTEALKKTPASDDAACLDLAERIHNAEMISAKITNLFPNLQAA